MMKFSLPNVSIIKLDGKYQFIGIKGGLHSSLGVYDSIQEGVCTILEKGKVEPIFRAELERLRREGVEVDWDEDKLFNLDLPFPTRKAALTLPRIFNRFTGIISACLLIGCLAGFSIGNRTVFDEIAFWRPQLPNGAVLCKPGPWGDLSYTPFSIAAPDDLLPVRSIEAMGTHWFLKGYTAESFSALLKSTSLSLDQQQAFLDPGVLHIQPGGIDLTPSPDLVFSLPQDARGKIYQILVQSIFADAQIHILPKDSIDERFSASGV